MTNIIYVFFLKLVFLTKKQNSGRTFFWNSDLQTKHHVSRFCHCAGTVQPLGKLGEPMCKTNPTSSLGVKVTLKLIVTYPLKNVGKGRRFFQVKRGQIVDFREGLIPLGS